MFTLIEDISGWQMSAFWLHGIFECFLLYMELVHYKNKETKKKKQTSYFKF